MALTIKTLLLLLTYDSRKGVSTSKNHVIFPFKFKKLPAPSSEAPLWNWQNLAGFRSL